MMTYELVKQCKKCRISFQTNSNRQVNCLGCRPIARKELMKKANAKHYMNTKDAKNEYSRTYNKSIKGIAAQKLRAAVRYGKIKRQPCEICSKPEAEGHHTDYSKPLDVKWLCRQHHAQTHLYKPYEVEMINTGYKGGFLLGELIEACGDFPNTHFSLYGRAQDRWEATEVGLSILDPEKTLGRKSFTFYGSTPEEAVAKLYLELNKNANNKAEKSI